MNRRSKARQRLDMFRHGITHVTLETVARMNLGEARHQPVTRYLGNDRRRRYRGNNGIAADNRLAVAVTVDTITTIHENELRTHRQSEHRACQRPQRGTQNVIAVDPSRRRHCDRNLGAGANLGVELLARFPVKLLGIVEATRHTLRVKDDRGGYDRAGQRSPSSLIAASDRPDATLERRALATKCRSGLLLLEQQPAGACGGVATHAAMVRRARPKSMRLQYQLQPYVKGGDNRSRPQSGSSKRPSAENGKCGLCAISQRCPSGSAK